MDNFRSRHIPADVLIFDLDWVRYHGRFMVDKENTNDAPGVPEGNWQGGFKAITIVEPYVFKSSRKFDDLMGNSFSRGNRRLALCISLLGKRAGRALLDFSNPETRRCSRKIARHQGERRDAWWT